MHELRTFEELLFPAQSRWEYAMGNCAHDARTVSRELKDHLYARAHTLYPGFDRAIPNTRIGVMSLMIPIGCNARCPSICYTNIADWRRRSEHLTACELLALVREFALLGGKLVRIIGDGEPTLHKDFPALCECIRTEGLNVIVFSNAVSIPTPVLREYEKGNLYFYLKLWSEREEVQNGMVAPCTPYRYTDGVMGRAPEAFYALREMDETRVGFQVMFSSANEADAWNIVEGPKSQLPLLVEDFLPFGAGNGNHELAPSKLVPATKACTRPERASYLAVVNSSGMLQAGTFVPVEAQPAKGRLGEVWGTVYASKELFFEARYPEVPGCFCAKQRQKQTGL